MKKNLFILLTSILFCACSEQNVDGEFFLRGQEVKFDSANENLWPQFLYGQTMFAWSDDNSIHAGKITEKEWQKAERISGAGVNNDLEGLFFSEGNNGELFVLNTPMVGLFDTNCFKSFIKIQNADNIADIMDRTKWDTYDLKKVLGFGGGSFVTLSDTTILVLGMFKDDLKRVYSIIDIKNQKLTPLDYCPEGKDLSDEDICMLYLTGKILGNGKGKMLYHNRCAKFAFIFNIEGTKVNILKNLYSYTFVPTRPTECLGCCANSDRIYMLIRDTNIKGEKCNEDDRFRYGNTVEVYDWDGIKHQVIHLDNYYREIMLSGDGNTLFLHPGMTGDIIKPALYSYDISNLKDNPMIDSIEIKNICKANFEKTKEKYGKKDVLKEGDMMADFELYDYNDKPHHLNEFVGKGKYTILVFSDLHCGWCQKSKPYLDKLYKQNKDKIEMITVSNDKLSEWKEKPNGEVSWHEWNDHNLAREIRKKYDVLGNPTFFVINSEGKIVKKYVGFAEQVFDEMKEIISKKK